MKLVFFLVVFSLSVCAAIKFEFPEEWGLWKDEHGKAYDSHLEELEKHLVWLSNKKYIEQHNANSHIFGYTLAMNQFGDMTEMQFFEMAYGYRKPNSTHFHHAKEFVHNSSQYIPDSVDWRSKGAVTSIKDQGYCGASYAFSAMGALEGAWALANEELVSLSEQNIVDCSVPYGNSGCRGGSVYDAFLYVIANEGVDLSESYPYKGKQSWCLFDSSKIGADMTGFVKIENGNEDDLKAAVATMGPVAVAVDAYSRGFQFYSEGVYDSSQCSTTELNHAILVTGYGTIDGQDYWLAKNSWGKYWGMYGYIMMTRNRSNQCGIASAASFPTM